jgi:hypothetical protein
VRARERERSREKDKRERREREREDRSAGDYIYKPPSENEKTAKH